MAANNAFQPVMPAVESFIHIELISDTQYKVVIDEMHLTGTLPKNIVDNPDSEIRYSSASDTEVYVDNEINWAKGYYEELVRNVKRMLHGTETIIELDLTLSLYEVTGADLGDYIPEDEEEAAEEKCMAPYWKAVDEGDALDINVPVTKDVADAAVAYFQQGMVMVQSPIESAWKHSTKINY